METRRLGRGGPAVSRLGLGLAALGRPGYVNLDHGQDLGDGTDVETLRARCWEVLDAAWAAGVRYLDAARSYGRAEEFLGAWLRERGIGPDEVTVGTKWGYTYTAGWRVHADVHEVKDHSLETLRRQVAESRALLGSHLDLLQVHSATLDSGVLEAVEVLDALAELRVAGTTRAIGVTLSGAGQAATLEAAMRVERDGRRLFDVVQATFNVLEPSIGPLLASASDAGMGVIVKEALANGRLVRGDAAEMLRPEADRLGIGLDRLALAFVLEQPWADVVLSGAAGVTQLRSNVAAGDVSLDDRARVALAGLAEAPDRYWRTRADLRWN